MSPKDSDSDPERFRLRSRLFLAACTRTCTCTRIARKGYEMTHFLLSLVSLIVLPHSSSSSTKSFAVGLCDEKTRTVRQATLITSMCVVTSTLHLLEKSGSVFFLKRLCCMLACIHVFMHVHTYTNIPHTFDARVCACMYAHLHVRKYVCTNKPHTFAESSGHIYVHACTCM